MDQEHRKSMPIPESGEARIPRLTNATGFNEFIKEGWGQPNRTPRSVPGVATAAANHRTRFAQAYPGRTIVAGAGFAPVRNDDVDFSFRVDSNFYWLTGCDAQNAVLVMQTGTGGDYTARLYLVPPFYPGDKGFYANAAHGELWVGSAPGLSDWSDALDIAVKPLSDLEADLAGYDRGAAAGRGGFEVVGGFSPHTALALDIRGPNGIGVRQDAELAAVLGKLRMIKDEWEIEQMRSAIAHTVDGFAAVVREFRAASEDKLGERWLQGTFDRYARTFGNGVGYSSITGSGANAAVLHWVHNDGPVLPDDLVLLDMGVEVKSYYTADVTRTFPVSGKFSETQRMVYDIVEKSHREALAVTGPGRPYSDFHFASMEVIATELHALGLLPVSVDEALSPDGQHHRRYIACGVGHHLGLDVHDCSQSHYEDYQGANFEPGMMFTVEPGLYFHAHDETLPPELRGIGVRIEDDLLITEDGAENISADLMPFAADEVEKWVQDRLQG